YQVMIDLGEQALAKAVVEDPKNYRPEMQGLSQYDMPSVLHPRPRKMLIVGSGSGNGTAAAFRHGVPEIVAVDIDPAIISMGSRYHPERPYPGPNSTGQSPVRVVNDDARSFFASCNEKFDVISFEFLDSHTMTSMTNARLDHYVYTRESFERAKSLLKEDGVLVLLFGVEKPFIADRMARALQEVFHQDPIVFPIPDSGYGPGGLTFVVGNQAAAQGQIDGNPRLKSLVQEWRATYPVELKGTTPVATDDWPYIYLESPRIPVLYVLLAVILMLLFARGLRQLRMGRALRVWDRSSWHFFFLGAAFMLLEVQNISKASVVLGNTWWVNAVIISGILALILIANWIVARFPGLPLTPVYGLLCGSCLALYFVDISWFGFLPFASKALLVGILTSLPMLFRGSVFISSFAQIAEKDLALGANLLGALVGGLLQSITFVIGIKSLLLIVAALYFASWLTRPKSAALTTVPVPST